MPAVALLVILGAAWYFSTSQERARFGRTLLASAGNLQDFLDRIRPDPTPFDAMLLERTPRVVVTPTIIAVSLVMFVFMLFGGKPLGDPATAIAWGASFGPLTTNGEWWRLLTAMLVDPHALHLLVVIIGLVQVGMLAERLVGPVPLAGSYVASGLLAAMVNLWLHPIVVTTGASASVFGVYGLFLATAIAGVAFPSPLTIPVSAMLHIAPTAGLFLLYSFAVGLGAGDVGGLFLGVVYGCVLARNPGERSAALPRVAAVTAAVLVCVIAAGVPRRGVTDVRPEIARVAEMEQHTAGIYDDAVHRFALGQLTLAELVDVIEKTILPELRAAQGRFKALHGVPKDQAPLVAQAGEYFKLRDESWRARAAGLRRKSLNGMRSPDDAERESLEALERITTP